MSQFDAAYDGTPPWDVGRPQDVVVALEEGGRFGHAVLDAGCGTGENALFLAGRGHDVVGIDTSPKAIAKARAKAADRATPVDFLVADALSLESLHRLFDSVVDCGLFHVLDDRQRRRYVRGLASVVRPGGSVYVLCFSEEERTSGGPRRVTQAELRAAFSTGWHVVSIKPARFASHLHAQGAAAWLAQVTRRAGSAPHVN